MIVGSPSLFLKASANWGERYNYRVGGGSGGVSAGKIGRRSNGKIGDCEQSKGQPKKKFISKRRSRNIHKLLAIDKDCLKLEKLCRFGIL